MILQLFKRATFWAALAGFGILAMMVNATTAKSPVPPHLSPPAQKPFALGIGASGIIEAIRENTKVGVPLPGLVIELPVKVRDKVNPGDVLIKLDDREVRIRLVTGLAALALREAELARARRQHDSLAQMDAGAVAREEVAIKADEVRVAAAALASAQASIQQTHEELERFIVRAPITGTVLQVNTRAGEYISPDSSTPPLVLGSIDELQVRVDVDEQLAPRVREHAQAVAFRKGAATEPIPLEFIRIEPFIIPKRNLTGDSMERVDTRVLPVIFRIRPQPGIITYVGQQVDIFIEEHGPAQVDQREGSSKTR